MDAVVVGAGPNGLAAAIVIARAGRSVQVFEANDTVGGGCRSAELTLPGFVHDVCSAVHPLAAGSPLFRELSLGVEWIHPDVPLAHPLDDGTAALLSRSLDVTAAGLGADGAAWRRIVGAVVRDWDRTERLRTGPFAHVPRHPLAEARFGLMALQPATLLARAFSGRPARALFAGCAAHSFLALSAPVSGAFALTLAASAHVHGWPVARGGSQRIADALAATLRSLGGAIETRHRVSELEALGPARAYLLDTSPRDLDRIAGRRLPQRYRRALRRYRHGPAAFKVDYALSAPVPWTAAGCARAGTVHLGGTLEEIASAEAEVARGGHPERPFVLVAQPSLFDPTRAPSGKHTLWAYCHVPNGSTVDMTARIEAQLERFAPGFHDLVLARHVSRPADLERENANYVGGDISAGAHSGIQLLARPVVRAVPYATPARDVYLCSAATPPGAGVHGMCGYHAARVALRRALS